MADTVVEAGILQLRGFAFASGHFAQDDKAFTSPRC